MGEYDIWRETQNDERIRRVYYRNSGESEFFPHFSYFKNPISGFLLFWNQSHEQPALSRTWSTKCSTVRVGNDLLLSDHLDVLHKDNCENFSTDFQFSTKNLQVHVFIPFGLLLALNLSIIHNVSRESSIGRILIEVNLCSFFKISNLFVMEL